MPQPVARYCNPMLTMLETTQYSASPLGKLRVQNPKIRGNIQFINCVCCRCLGSVLGTVDIFWTTHMDAPTRMGMIIMVRGAESGRPRSIQRK